MAKRVQTTDQDARVKHFQDAVAHAKQRRAGFETMGGLDLQTLGYPENPDDTYFEQLGMPGQYPYTRGVHPTM